MTTSFLAIYFFYDSVIISREHLKRSTCQGLCVYFTTLVAGIHYNKRSVVDSRKFEGCVYCLKHFSILSFFNLTIPQQQLQLFIKYSKFFRRANALARVTFGASTFSKELLFWSTYSLNLGTATAKRIYLKHQIFVKTICFFSKQILQAPILESGVSFYLKRWAEIGHSFF